MDYTRLGIVYNPKEQNSIIQRDITKRFENKMGFKTFEFEITGMEDIPKIMPLLEDEVEAIYIPADSKIISLGKEIAVWINRYNIPSLASVESMVTEDGILLGLVPDFYQLG